MRSFLIFFLISLVLQLQASNNTYFIRNYNPADNNEQFSSDLYCVTQTPNGILFFGTKNGVYTFDGTNTLFFPIVENDYVISCLAVNNSTIYLGLTHGFGCLTKNKAGKYNFEIFKQGASADKVYKIVQYNNDIVFCSRSGLYFFDQKNHFKHEIKPSGEASANSYFHNVFNVSGQLYVRQAGTGLLKYVNRQLESIPSGSYFKDIGVFNIRYRNKTLEILSVDSGFYFINKSGVTRKSVSYLENAKVRGAQILHDGKLAVYSANHGVFLIDSAYRQIANISYQNGLSSGKINQIHADFYGNIWTAGENGFHFIAYSSPVMLYDKETGLPGKIHGISLSGETFYVTSSLGLFTTNSSLSSFNQLKQVRSAAWDLKKIGDQLLIATDNGLYTARNGKVAKRTEEGIQYIFVAPDEKSFYTLGKTGISHYNLNFKLIRDVKFENPIDNITSYVYLNSLVYLSAFNTDSTTGSKIYCYDLARKEIGLKRAISINPGQVYSIGEKIYYSTLDSNFELLNGKIVKSTGALSKYAGIQAYFSEPGLNIAAFGNRIGRIVNESVDYNDFNAITFQKVFTISKINNRLFFCTDKGLFVYYSERKPSGLTYPHFTISLLQQNNMVEFSDSLNFIRLPFHENSFNILFTSTYFDNNKPASFFWRVRENSNDWTETNNQHVASFFNASPGKYTLEVKSRSIQGQESPVKSISIEVLAPWYRTNLAYFSYLLLLSSIIFLGIRLYVWRLRKQNLILENKVELRTRELQIKTNELEQKKTETELQKQQIENAHREITDSINYAKRIQTAVLPDNEYIRKIVDRFFVFYKPRNVVSGDFYWINKVGNEVIIIAADCTGHGVPGAFMSLLGISLLNEIILEKKITSPEQILNHLREQLVKLLNPNDRIDESEVVYDGMDISVCTICQESGELLFAGANNKMFLVRTGNKEIIEIEADNMPAGYYDIMNPFRLQKVHFQDGDMAIMCSDGFKDQFGGSAGKKYMAKRFKDFLLTIEKDHEHPETVFEQEFLQWKGDNHQVDDVMVLGFFVKSLKA